MGVDTIIHYACVPKEQFSIEGIIARLKGRDRARAVIKYYREKGDERPIDEIGFEVSRQDAEGQSDTQTVIAADLIQAANELDDVAHYCKDCPANAHSRPFGCIGYLNYPISTQAEVWLLQQLPSPNDDPLLFLMLKKGIEEFGYSGDKPRELRNQVGVFFENPDTLGRQYPELTVTTDQIFEMMFLLGHIQPGHAAMLLLFFNAIPRTDLEAPDIMQLARADAAANTEAELPPFNHQPAPDDDASITDIKAFFQALYTAYRLKQHVLLDV